MSKELLDIVANAETDKAIISKLEIIVTQLLETDPEKLIHGLYRIDVDEKKFTAALQNQTKVAVKDIAQLIYERAMEKLESKKRFSGSRNLSSEEKW
ncbi:MAG: hypothetical protein ABIR81_02955 [Ginsengibacter sp.]